MATETKFCKECGSKIDKDASKCPICGADLRESAQPQIVINNSNQNSNQNIVGGHRGTAKNKWVAFFLCFFFGLVGAHKFYEGKVGMGILYLFTGGLFGIGVLIDFFRLLFASNPYYV